MPELELKDRKAKCLAVFGTGSDVGKSIVATALCRIFANKDMKVAPFKAQNMSNNSGITPEGLEMGRAQIVQAEAAMIPPNVDMNPVLLKPTSEKGAQIVLCGMAIGNSTAKQYHSKKNKLLKTAYAALDNLRTKYDLVILEGAGSCAEVNLMPNDIVNFRMAMYSDAPVIVVADIHKGGVFAQIVGTMECLSDKHRNMIAGFIINRFRGDISLFADGVKWIEKKTGKKIFGVLPWYNHITIEAEDSVVIENVRKVPNKKCHEPLIAILRIPHISNFTDFDPLFNLQGLNIYFVEKVQDLSFFKAVIIPGSKNTRFDLNWLHTTKWSQKLHEYSDKNGHILGICGGYQMMGRFVHDPDGLEGKPGKTDGLCLLPVETYLKAPKTTTLTEFSWNNMHASGYEIHMGYTIRDKASPMLKVSKRNNLTCTDYDGCVTDNMKNMGTYMHGFFDTPEITDMWLKSIGIGDIHVAMAYGPAARSDQYNLLADHFKKHVDVDSIAEKIYE